MYRKFVLCGMLCGALLLAGCAGDGEFGASGEEALEHAESSTLIMSVESLEALSDAPNVSATGSQTERHEHAPPEEVSLISLLDTIGVIGTDEDMRNLLSDAPPGTLPPVERMPKAEQTLVGTTVELCLSPWESRGDNGCGENFLYQNGQTERVALVAPTGEWDFLLIGEVSVGGTEAWARAVSAGDTVTVKILSVTLIHWSECMYTRICDLSNFTEEELTYEAHSLATEYCLGTLEDGEIRMVFKTRDERTSDPMNIKCRPTGIYSSGTR